MISCALCDNHPNFNRLCSPLALVMLHWMNDHPIEYGQRHPESVPYMSNHPGYREGRRQ